MFKFWKIIWVVGILLLSQSLQAIPVSIESVRYWTESDHTRMVFDVTSQASHQVFLLENPTRVVIDFHNTKLKKNLPKLPSKHHLLSRVRSATRHKKDLRIVVDLKATVTPKSFFLKPDKKNGHRLVVDLYPKNKKNSKSVGNKQSYKKVAKTVKNNARNIIIAIDAGHGGKDPGAHGPSGTQEKKVVFSIAKKLSALINKKRGMKAVMVRKGDYFVGLQKRMKIARDADADLFVSIHADAFKNSKVKGASVFTLSKRGESSSEAASWLAKHENLADLVGGNVPKDMDDTVASVILDLSQTATKEASRDVAGSVLKHFKTIGDLHKNDVQKARFMVLKSPNMPSILVETAFISNPKEERKLKSSRHQAKMANAIFKGIVGYFKQRAPADTYFALNTIKKHVISRGDTLSGIAQQYGVSMRSIKSVNSLASNQIQIGQVLKIPRG